jgi:DNA polymerase III epsilon subunit family exonuclease
MEYVVFDIETTGLDTDIDRIIELGAIRVLNGEVVGVFDKLINPGIIISDFITNINGISNEMVKDADYPGVVLSEFNRFVSGVEFLVGHNAYFFDYPFIQSEFKRNLIKHDKLYVKDTMFIAKKKIPRFRSYSLKNLTEHLGIVNQTAHRALSDVYATFELFEKLNKM